MTVERGGPGKHRVRRASLFRILSSADVLLPVALVLLLAVWAYVLDPIASGYTIPCPWFELTGSKCPGCGLQRSTYALLHADLRTALAENLLTPLLLPLTFAAFATWYLQRLPAFSNRRFNLPTPLIVILAFVIIAYWIIRNIPGTPFP